MRPKFCIAVVLALWASACAKVAPPIPPSPITSHSPSVNDYPPLAVQAHQQGTARVRYVVYEDGNVGNIQIVNSSGSKELDDASVAVITRWRFKPATQSGKAIRSEQFAAIHWVLK